MNKIDNNYVYFTYLNFTHMVSKCRNT